MQQDWAVSDLDVLTKAVEDCIMSTIQLGMKHDLVLISISSMSVMLPFVARIMKKKMGCDFFCPAMNLEDSIVMGKENAKKEFAQIQAGEN
eukprot:14666842-Ditylum_brightwellii.AAC.1